MGSSLDWHLTPPQEERPMDSGPCDMGQHCRKEGWAQASLSSTSGQLAMAWNDEVRLKKTRQS